MPYNDKMSSVTSLTRSSLIPGFLTSGVNKNNNIENGRRTSLLSEKSVKSSSPKSFYRQPNVQRVRPVQSGELRRKQYAQRFMWFSEGYYLPPQDLQFSHNFSRRHSSAEIYKPDPDIVPRFSILKRGDSSDSDGGPPSPVDVHIRRSNSSQKKQTKFREDVDVFYYDRRERPTSSSTREQRRLKDENKIEDRLTDRTLHVACTLHKDPSKCIQQGNQDNENEPECDCPSSEEPIFANKEIEIVEGESGKHSWRLVVPIGHEYIRNRTSVKALSGGRKLIVMTFKEMTFKSGEKFLHQFVERLHLPHPIDAYSVRASMDKDGNLKINAPFTTQQSAS